MEQKFTDNAFVKFFKSVGAWFVGLWKVGNVFILAAVRFVDAVNGGDKRVHFFRVFHSISPKSVCE